jgi:type IV pilus assembly protein PilA
MFKKLGTKLKEQKGFTLIELLAVIVILGIIAAIAIPAISNVISKSEAKSQAQEGLQIINAAKLYVANTNYVLPATLPTDGSNEFTQDELAEYLDRTDDPTFTVIVKHNTATGGGYTYELTKHEVNGSSQDVGISEDTLLTKAK